MNNKKKTK